jgi:hypothetical protein
MDSERIKFALADITAEQDPTLKSAILRGGIVVHWNEVRRLANHPEYRNLQECEKLILEVADELKIKSPLHSNPN